MDLWIATILAQDGVAGRAIDTSLALVTSVTRVICICKASLPRLARPGLP